jgi:hypothetical protein
MVDQIILERGTIKRPHSTTRSLKLNFMIQLAATSEAIKPLRYLSVDQAYLAKAVFCGDWLTDLRKSPRSAANTVRLPIHAIVSR